MSIAFNAIKKSIGIKTVAITVAALMMVPTIGFGQEEQEDGFGSGSSSDQQGQSVPAVTGSTSPWGNVTGAEGTTDQQDGTTTSTGEVRSRDSRANGTAPAGAANRPAGTLDRDPGGNPDVPFDANMNLAFLAAGVGFAFIVMRKRLKLKEAPVSSK